MMFSTKRIIALLLLVFVFTLGYAKKDKFAKVSKADLELTSCPIDSSAKAYYMLDEGESNWLFYGRFTLSFERHVRLKILDKEAFDKANFEFLIDVDFNGAKEIINNIKGTTYNLKDGRLVTTALSDKDIVRSSEGKYADLVRFSMPDVRVGSIIDLKYTISSVYMHMLQDWQFQYDIPVLQSHYRVVIPQYFSFTQYPYHAELFDLEQYETHGNINYSVDTDFDFVNTVLAYKATNVPAIVSSGKRPLRDVASRVEFQLQTIAFPSLFVNFDVTDQQTRSVVPDWKGVNKELVVSEDFTKRLNERAVFAEPTYQVLTMADSIPAQLYLAMKSVAALVKWNGEVSSHVLQPISQTLQKGEGSCADINMSLVLFLREMGFDAYPVVLSTKGNGLVRQHKPSSSQFNYVICAVSRGGDYTLLDATAPDSGLNQLPERCRNGFGLLIDKENVRWIDLME